MLYSYSVAGIDYSIVATGNVTIFDNVTQLIQKFTSPIFQENRTEETTTQCRHTSIEIPIFTMDGFSTVKPIKINIEYLSDDEYIASFEEAGIAFSADTALDAIQEFKIEFIEVYKCYKSEPCLGRWPKKQLAILESYIGKKKV